MQLAQTSWLHTVAESNYMLSMILIVILHIKTKNADVLARLKRHERLK